MDKMAEYKEFGQNSIGCLVDLDHIITLIVARQIVQLTIQNPKSLKGNP